MGSWSADVDNNPRRITDEEREELMSVGAAIIADVKESLETSASNIRTRFEHGVTLELGGSGDKLTRSVEMLLFFVFTDLGDSDEEQVKAFIQQRLLEIFSDPSYLKYKAQQSFEVVSEE